MTSHATDNESGSADDAALAVCVEADAASSPDLDGSETIPLDSPASFELCGECGGPTYFCNGESCSREGAADLDTASLVWLTAIRALLLGTFLSRNVASSYGGVLILAARAMVGESAPTATSSLPSRMPHPGFDVSREEAVALAVAYLHDGDLGALSRLSASLRTTNDPLLWKRRAAAERAALTPPWQNARHALLAVVCDACAGGRALAGDILGASVPWTRRLGGAVTYDSAILCLSCGAAHAHPLPGLPIGRPHPVTRCTGGLDGDPERCMVHGEGLGPEGACSVALPVLTRARAWAAERPELRLPWERDLARAVLQAQRVELERRIANGEIVKRIVGSPELRPFFATAASLSPEVARGLEQITGEPFRAEEADAEALEFFRDLAPVFKGLAQAGGLVTRLLGGASKQRRSRRSLPGGSR
jgi:hypothetical protein